MPRAAQKKSAPPKKADPRRPAWSPLIIAAPVSEGPTVTVSASVPETLVDRVREAVGSREFSLFVTQAIRSELQRLNLRQLADEIEAVSGPPDPREVARITRLLQE